MDDSLNKIKEDCKKLKKEISYKRIPKKRADSNEMPRRKKVTRDD